jgi:UDPglucose 6-dehydrogenase
MERNKIKVGIIGCGFVGTALKNWLQESNPSVETLVSDPPKGINDDISGCDAYFI